jgi:transmembrane sensor
MGKSWKGFYRLIHRYQNNTINPIKKQVMDFWYDSINHSKTDELQQEDQKLKSDIWNSIRQQMHEAPEMAEPLIGKRWWQSVYFKFAATAVFLITGFIFYKGGIIERKSIIAKVPDSMISKLVRNENDSKKLKLVRLPDGSQVSLDPGAILFYPLAFTANERNVFLKGDGFFDVTHDPGKPFTVYSDHIITKVLGTSFTIKTNKQGNVEVAVLRGLVKVKENADRTVASTDSKEVTLTPNKKVTFSFETKEMITGLVEEPVLVARRETVTDLANTFIYTDAPVTTIIPQLEKAFGVAILLDNKNLANCSITADASNLTDLFGLLDVLCAAIDASYEVRGDQVFLTGPGCSAIQ